jgi:hypothetical protein
LNFGGKLPEKDDKIPNAMIFFEDCFEYSGLMTKSLGILKFLGIL